MKKKKTNKSMYILSWIFFLIYIFVLFYILFLSPSLGRNLEFQRMLHEELGYRVVNYIPFREIIRIINGVEYTGLNYVLANIAGNIALFMPFGILFPLVAKAKFWPTFAAGTALSAACEAAQYITRLGTCDIDDVILNATGTAVGYFIVRLFLRKKR